MDTFDKYDLLDKFLKGTINPEEKLHFNQLIEVDPNFAQEVKESQELLTLMVEYKEEKDLRAQLSDHHSPSNRPRKKNNNKLWLITGIAASFSILAVFSTLFTLGYFNNVPADINPIQELSFEDLSKDVSKIQTSQEDIEQKIKEIEDQITNNTSRNGTCFPITTTGLLVTNYHVIKNAKKIKIESAFDSNESFAVKVVYKDKDLDIAILNITDSAFTKFERIPYAISNRKLKLSENLYTLGYPKKDIVFGEGSVSSYSGYNGDSTKFEVSIPVNPGNSGSPVFDKQGYIVGLIDSKNKNKVGTSYVIKSEYLNTVIDSISSDYNNSNAIFNQSNRLKWKKREDQVQQLTKFVYRVKVLK